MIRIYQFMLAVLLCIAISIFFVAASGQEWTKVDTKNATSPVYYHPNSLLGSKKWKLLWLNVIYDKESLVRVLDNNKEDIDAYSHTFLKVYINCVNSRYTPLEEFNYSINGGSLGGGSDFLEPRQYTKILPGTAENVWKNLACNTGPLKQMEVTLKTIILNWGI